MEVFGTSEFNDLDGRVNTFGNTVYLYPACPPDRPRPVHLTNVASCSDAPTTSTDLISDFSNFFFGLSSDPLEHCGLLVMFWLILPVKHAKIKQVL